MRRAQRDRGFTLIELLIVVAIIGIIVAVVMINLINAIERARQRRTMADMRSISTAIEAYAIDRNAYPPAAGFTLPPGLSLPTKTLANTALYVEPTYIKTMPLTDGWNSWFQYDVSTLGTDYILRSAGRDGIPQATGAVSFGVTTNFNADIIFVNGMFVQYPEGIQN
jgi:general secretion pathway protein G